MPEEAAGVLAERGLLRGRTQAARLIGGDRAARKSSESGRWKSCPTVSESRKLSKVKAVHQQFGVFGKRRSDAASEKQRPLSEAGRLQQWGRDNEE
jgi:hypothetical protein